MSESGWDLCLPGIDEVLGQANAGGRAGDGHLAVGGAIHRVGNLDLSARHLPDLIDLGALAADDASDQLCRAGGGDERVNTDVCFGQASGGIREQCLKPMLSHRISDGATEKSRRHWDAKMQLLG